ncbi:hypothetical protein M0812_02455 [Anaeramoeba flamelloides]|uniref:Uncharacterized protein n=1 Tax=Anaeramoeba flamelloides TaxID=1746091 RepID=A0AAV7YLY3_9EUKA|nr:hypothetical protein M0812_02455 [Anaeramoeba flamelloides]
MLARLFSPRFSLFSRLSSYPSFFNYHFLITSESESERESVRNNNEKNNNKNRINQEVQAHTKRRNMIENYFGDVFSEMENSFQKFWTLEEESEEELSTKKDQNNKIETQQKIEKVNETQIEKEEEEEEEEIEKENKKNYSFEFYSKKYFSMDQQGEKKIQEIHHEKKMKDGKKSEKILRKRQYNDKKFTEETIIDPENTEPKKKIQLKNINENELESFHKQFVNMNLFSSPKQHLLKNNANTEQETGEEKENTNQNIHKDVNEKEMEKLKEK